MAKYLISLDNEVYADNAAGETAITDTGASIYTTFNLPLTYEIEATPEQMNNISNIALQEYSTLSTQIIPQGATFNLAHLNYTQDPQGNITYQNVQNGAGVDVFLIDTGINPSHQEFTSANISNLWTNFSDDSDIDDYLDVVGHGTAVGSLIAGGNIGAAPGAQIHNVKLFNAVDGNVTIGEIVNSLDAVYNYHQGNDNTKTKIVCTPWVISQNSFVDAKIQQMNQNNIIVVASAGNNGEDVNQFSPAGNDFAITVGAFNSSNEVTTFTNGPTTDGSTGFVNYGASLDCFALAVDISVADSSNVSNYNTSTGTSLAAGIAAGAIAGYAQRDTDLSAPELKERFLAEGHMWGVNDLTYDNANVNYDTVYKSMVTTISNQMPVLFAEQSGRIKNVQHGTSTTVDLGKVANSSEIAVLDFAPLPPWISLDVNTGIVTIDGTHADCSADLAPGVYIFAVKGTVSPSSDSADNVIVVEEYSVGLYTTNESEVDGSGDGSISSYYYDNTNNEYDEVVNYQVAPSSTPSFKH
jgi:subtilisin family serine protease